MAQHVVGRGRKRLFPFRVALGHGEGGQGWRAAEAGARRAGKKKADEISSLHVVSPTPGAMSADVTGYCSRRFEKSYGTSDRGARYLPVPKGDCGWTRIGLRALPTRPRAP